MNNNIKLTGFFELQKKNVQNIQSIQNIQKMSIFQQLDYNLAARVNSYLNTRKLVYSKFADKESWAMINAIPHSYCIKKAQIDKKAWEYISGRKRFGTRRTWHSYTGDCFGMYCKRKDLLDAPKWETRVEKNYYGFGRRRMLRYEPFYAFRDMIHELENSSVKDKYNQIRKEKYYHLLESIEFEYTNQDICDELQGLISKKIESVQDVIKYKLGLIYKMSCYDREKLWKLLKVLESVDYDNVFQLLDMDTFQA